MPRIDELNEILAADLADDDVLLVKVKGGPDKKVKVSELEALFGGTAESPNIAYVTESALTTSEVQTMSGTSVDFDDADFFDGAKVVFIGVRQVSLSSNEDWMLQLGDAGGIETSGYNSAGSRTGASAVNTAGVETEGIIVNPFDGNNKISLNFVLTNTTGNDWVVSYSGSDEVSSNGYHGGGSKALSAALTRIRFKSANTNTFDDGEFTVMVVREIANTIAIPITAPDDVTAATQAEQEAGTKENAFVAPATQHYHPSAAKAWINFNGVTTIAERVSYNISGIVEDSSGRYTVSFDTDFSSADYAAVANYNHTDSNAGANNDGQASCWNFAAGSVSITCPRGDGAVADREIVSLVVYGDH